MNRAKHLLIVGAIAAAAAASAFALQDAFNLRVNPAKDQSFVYKYSGVLNLMGSEAKAEYTSKTLIVEVSDKGALTTETSDVKGTVNFGGQEMEMPDMGATKTTADAGGVTTNIEGGATGAEAYRSAAVMTIFRPENPVKVGEEWTWSAAADTAKGTRKTEGKYKLAAVETIGKIECLLIEFDVKEAEGASPASVKGKTWVSKANGLAVKSEATVTDFPIPGAPEPVSGTIKSELVQE